jgi:diguanylate cyclase (GGDEF)-like protein
MVVGRGWVGRGIDTMGQFGNTLAHAHERRIAALEAELSKAHTTIKELAAKCETDALLDIPNRRGFERELKRALLFVQRYGSGIAVIFIDVDDFKSINDRHGHLAGDMVLKTVAATLYGRLRGSDIFARFGGDEFATILWNVNEFNARAKAVCLEDAIASLQIQHATELLSVSASAGLTLLQPGDTSEKIIERADKDMYCRKRSKSAY